MNILDETAAALPEVTERLRGFLAPELGQPADEAASAPVPAAPEAEAAEAESGSEDEGPEPDEAADVDPHPDGELTPRELAAGYSLGSPQPPPTAEADASALADHPLDGAQ